MQRERIQLTAGILNSQKEVEIYQWLALIVPEYGDKPFNKRFETWLNKESAERFKTEVLRDWGINGEDKIINLVNFGFHKADFSIDDDKYELRFYYKGKALRYDYATKSNVLDNKNESEQLFGLKNTAEIVEWANRIIPNRQENIAKMQSNLRNLDRLKHERDILKAKIDLYNNKISYAISDSMRIK